MSVKRQMLSIVRMALPVLGFVVTCLGAYLVTLQTKYALIIIPVYVMIGCGFLAMLIGVFWNICHSMRSKIYHRGRPEQSIQVFTIERPSCFPPSYEESQESQVCPDSPAGFVVAVHGMDMVMSLAPPLYSQDASEITDCTWSWERPPPYSQEEQIQSGQMGAEEQREVSSGL